MWSSGLLKFMIKHRKITSSVQQTRESRRKMEKDFQCRNSYSSFLGNRIVLLPKNVGGSSVCAI